MTPWSLLVAAPSRVRPRSGDLPAGAAGAGPPQHSARADRMHIHPNSLYQRLSRIGLVLGDDWREPDAALDLLVALRLHRMAGALRR